MIKWNFKRLSAPGRLVFYLLVIYIFASFSWWGFLLLQHNRQVFEQTVSLIQLKESGQISAEVRDFPGREETIASATSRYKRQFWMIIGEGSVFIFLMILGLARVRSSLIKDIALARRQRNFMLSITHELKSPLASIKLVLETFFKRNLPDEHRVKLAGNSLSDVKRLEDLVDNILLASRIEGSEMPFDKEEINFSQMLERLSSRWMEQSDSDHAIRFFIEPDLEILADPTAMISLCNNLIENAIKYSPADSLIEIHLKKKGKGGLLVIQDQGPGIPDSEKDQVFEKFYRIGNEDTRMAKGTGLGLYLVKKIAVFHDFELLLTDNQPAGARFELRFPLLNPEG